ncbi:MAG: magnesium transporter CorA family protein [Candidatus Wallbacteria bacterium]|nr:magnesium transporter CorA family protein [Candidatus Wallbacteria bacterium]
MSARFYHISPKGVITKCPGLNEALTSIKGDGYIWLDYFDPVADELNLLIEPLGIHTLSIEDCLDESQIPKIEDFQSNTFILFNSLYYLNQKLLVDEVDFIIGKKFLVTVNGHQTENRNSLEKIEEMIRIKTNEVSQGPDHLLHFIMDVIIDRKFLAIETVQEKLHAYEEDLLSDPIHFNLAHLIEMRQVFLALRKSLFHEREILVKICRKDSPYISDKSIYHYRDIYDHLVKYFESVEIYREMINGLMEMYLSMMNNSITLMANQTNLVVKRLTLITTIFMPLSFFAGVGGMSEWSMMTGPEHWKIAYPAFLLGMGIIGYINYLILKRLKWL